MKSTGDDFENRAVNWLSNHGHRTVCRNFRASTGEIDIISLEADRLVFVEVRARTDGRFGGAALSIDRRKQRRLIQTAQLFLQRHPEYSHRPCRFDVLAFEPPQSAGEFKVRWIKAAFHA